MARPSHQADPALRRQVEALAGYGIPELGIARLMHRQKDAGTCGP
ncbi:hypothetical protein [Mesorhizobium sp.]|nr:hypothetical protein [Mesorhizobium sp.]